ncbi:4-hydroxy-tetrahydrodipicolinate reductase [Methanococcus voltae PS]|uniref:4-hydroxy-tetrahydrodipicolinate reductase n=1 Tax=Methanococcus voltae PS TaxID=523842 RepID=A0ABT2EUX2_METVO|nr:4-hydroxy-tetrahydrodipicolinate reductase [Methanococcus voltae]MCS3921755.1 4-hydroxy-tetrahydrodipicolinate reductase [Methanococcus voltae PS]
MIKIAVTGAVGRMGSGIIKNILESEDMELVAGIEAPGNPKKGLDIGEVIGVGKLGIPVSTADELEKVLSEAKPDVLVDFTAPAPCVGTVKTASKLGINLVIGTTGFTDEQRAEMETAIKENGVSAVISQNYAIGVNIFFKTLELLADKLSNYDIEIVEMHHKHKKDAPSGTALRAAEIIQENLNRDSNVIYGREGITGARAKEEICIHALRGGDVVGDHTVIFTEEGERLELSHKACSRQPLISGALIAVRYIVGKKAGIYNTFDVLGLNE